jgi:hypothetical protein
MRFAEEGRAIFCNGIPDLKITHLELEEPHNWMTAVPDGSVIVIDEVQRIWRPAGSGSAVPPSIEALETHRHHGIEFIVMTQHPNLMHANVRRLVGRHIHLRDLGFLGRHWYEWPEAANPESWKNALVKKRFKLPRKAFRMYKSASLHVKPIRSVPRALIMFAICVPLLGYMGYRVYSRISSFTDGKETKSIDAAVGKSKGEVKKLDLADVTAAKPRKVLPVADALQLEQEQPKRLLVGCINQGARCECIDDTGYWATVELKVCQESSARSGLAIPYSVQASAVKKPAAAGQRVETKALTAPAAAAPGLRPAPSNQPSPARPSPLLRERTAAAH